MDRLLLPSREDHRVAWLAGLAISLHVLEAALPMPLPGIKPGISNIVTVVVLCQMGLRCALWVTVLRVIVGSVVLGTFLSPTFVLSLSGAIWAMPALALCYFYNQICGWFPMGPVGFSVIAALAHMAGQITSAYFLFIPHEGLLKLAPALLIAAVVFGLINGLLTYKTLEYLKK